MRSPAPSSTTALGELRDRTFESQRHCASGCCSAWNKDPAFGMIGLQKGPPWHVGPQCFEGRSGAGIGMLVVETIAKIRRAYFVQKKAIKEIFRELSISRKVVRRVLRSGATDFEYERKVQPQPKIGPWRDELDRLLATNAARASRERLTLIRVFEELRGLGYSGGYDAVRRTRRPGGGSVRPRRRRPSCR